jgi:hypothetical protein
MSTLKVTTLQDTSAGNSSTTAQIAEGRAKAWFNLNGTGTPAFRDSFNCTGITDNGTGDLTVEITTDFGSVNYAAVGTAKEADSTSVSGTNIEFNSQAAGSIRLITCNASFSACDSVLVFGAMFGDQ